VSVRADEWTEVASYEKDACHAVFQYGCIVLGQSSSDHALALFSGQAVRGFDDRCHVVRFNHPGSA
jgi:hypothetical protein